MPAFLIPAAIAAGGAALNYFNGASAGKAKEKAAKQNIAAQRELQGKADAATKQMLAGLATSNPEAYRADIEGNFIKQLLAHRGTANTSMTRVPMASSRYQNDVASRIASTDADARGMAADWAVMDAAGRQRMSEGQSAARLGSTLDALKRRSAGSTATSNMRIENTAANPWVGMVGNAMQTYGKWAAGRPG
jgi:hypothetical protein